MMLYWEDSGCGIGFYYCFVVSLLILFIVFLKSKIIVVELEVLRKRLSDMLFQISNMKLFFEGFLNFKRGFLSLGRFFGRNKCGFLRKVDKSCLIVYYMNNFYQILYYKFIFFCCIENGVCFDLYGIKIV